MSDIKNATVVNWIENDDTGTILRTLPKNSIVIFEMDTGNFSSPKPVECLFMGNCFFNPISKGFIKFMFFTI